MNINWYPGHMAKARRQLEEQIRRVDLVIELCDARLPFSSRNPDLNSLTAGRKRILLMNKADLADPAMNDCWLKAFRTQEITVAACDMNRFRPKQITDMITEASRDKVEKAAEKGVRKTVRVMVTGVPNVGKSTFINRMHGGSIAQTGDRPGVTKGNQWVRIGPYLELLDTPGLLWPRLDDQTAARRLCYIGSVKDDVVDLYDLTIHLLDELAALREDQLREHFHLSVPVRRGEELLEDVCRGRGFLLRGNQPDYDRCCSVVLDEFRSGKIGRITLESPES